MFYIDCDDNVFLKYILTGAVTKTIDGLFITSKDLVIKLVNCSDNSYKVLKCSELYNLIRTYKISVVNFSTTYDSSVNTLISYIMPDYYAPKLNSIELQTIFLSNYHRIFKSDKINWKSDKIIGDNYFYYSVEHSNSQQGVIYYNNKEIFRKSGCWHIVCLDRDCYGIYLITIESKDINECHLIHFRKEKWVGSICFYKFTDFFNDVEAQSQLQKAYNELSTS